MASALDLLAPLLGDARVVEGGDEALRISIALREALRGEGNCAVQRVQPGYCAAQISTVEGLFAVQAFETGLLGRIAPRRYSAPGRQWRALWSCIDRNVPCARPVAVLLAGNVSYLACERSSAFVAFNLWLAKERMRVLAEPSLARSLASGLAAFVASLHRAGALLEDFNPGQIALRPPRPGSDRFEFQLLEIDSEPKVSSEAARLANLGEFALHFMRWPATVKMRFLQDYRALIGDTQPARSVLRMISERAQARQFELNTLLVAHCAEPSAAQVVVRRGDTMLLVSHRAGEGGLEELEQSLGEAQPAQWEALVTRHFESRAGEGAVCRVVTPLDASGKPPWQRRLESTWGRLLELDGLGARAPLPLACVATAQTLTVLGRVAGRIESLAAHRHDRDWKVIDELAHELVRWHGAGLYLLPGEAAQTLTALNVCVDERGARDFLLTSPERLFRGTPSQLGTQAVASLGRAARAVGEAMGERALKELVWSYARALYLNRVDADMLMEEAARVPTGRTLVMTRGIERSRVASGARG